jgi:hypothetical protein
MTDPELTVDESRLSRERGLEMEWRHPVFTLLAKETAAIFKESGAVNYVEYTFQTEEYGAMTVCIQRLAGETPAMQNTRLRQRIAELEASAPPDAGRRFSQGDLVRKIGGSEWEGRVVGYYSTDLTPEGYAVESSAHRGSVQIYPAAALEAVRGK